MLAAKASELSQKLLMIALHKKKTRNKLNFEQGMNIIYRMQPWWKLTHISKFDYLKQYMVNINKLEA